LIAAVSLKSSSTNESTPLRAKQWTHSR